MTTATIEYASAPPALPSEFDVELELEHGRWLRRRFLWMCGVLWVLALASLLWSVAEGLGGWDSNAMSAVESGFGVLFWAAAFAYARRAPPNRATFLSLAFWLFLVSTGLSLLLTRVQAEVFRAEWELEPNTSGGLTPAMFWAWFAPALLLMQHFITCLFIPWTLREALRPAAVLVALVSVLTVIDTATGRATLWALLPIPLAALAAAPGALVCWWRYSRFQRKFRLVFESSRYRKLQQELAGARRVHESCLPPARIDGGPVCLSYAYEPMRFIGGDLLFVHPAPDTRRDGSGVAPAAPFSAVLLDVTGHGIAAALGVNRLVGELERLFAERPDIAPADLLGALNRYVCLTLARHNMFATALCVRADPNRDLLLWANGGHPTAFLRRPGGAVERLEPTGMMLGVCDGTDYQPEQGELAFGRGDALLVYTDGAAEAWSATGKVFGIAGIQKLVTEVGAGGTSACDWPDAILRRVQAHRAAPPDDDTLVAAVYRPG